MQITAQLILRNSLWYAYTISWYNHIIIPDFFSQISTDDGEACNTKGVANEIEDTKGNTGTRGSCAHMWPYLASPGMRVILILTPIMWFCLRSIYVGIVINANNFTG